MVRLKYTLSSTLVLVMRILLYEIRKIKKCESGIIIVRAPVQELF